MSEEDDTMSNPTTTTNHTNYQPGDVVNGHRLSEDGTRWVPVTEQHTSPITTAADVPQTKSWVARHKILTTVGAVAALAIVGSALSGGDESAEPVAASEPAVEQEAPAQESTTTVEEPETVAAEQETEAAPAEEEPAAEEQAPDAEASTLPQDQLEFVQLVDDYRQQIRGESNDLRESALLRERDEALASLLGPQLTVENWTGTISEIGANGEGKAYVEIEIADDVRVGTWNNAFSDFDANTLIEPSSPLFDTLLTMDEGATVTFSGTFFAGSDTALYGKNMTEAFYSIDPKFLFDFTDIQ